MNWIKENKFLTGVLAVLVLGLGALGYLLFGARGQLAEATEQYERQVAERTRLHHLKPYPSSENVKELEGQKVQATEKITALQKALAASELPVEPTTAVQFQDKLRAAVTEVKAAAAAAPTRLPDKFFLGFDRYEGTTPDAAAAAPLGRQLNALQWVVSRFIAAKTAEIREFARDPLPEEGGKSKDAPPAAAPGVKPVKPVAPLVVPHGIDLKVFGDPSGLRTVLNEIVHSKEQFYIVRQVTFKNEKDKGPPRAEQAVVAQDGAAVDGAATPTPAPAAVPGAPVSTFIVGLEKVEMTLRLEMIDFADVPAPPAAK